MDKVTLKIMTRELCHEFYRGFQNDPDIFMDMSKFFTYQYSKEKVDRYFDQQQIPTRVVFMIMYNGNPLGEVKLKNIDYQKKECTLSIHLQNDSIKGKGIGTVAEKMALEYAFNKLDINVVNADAVLKNKRSQHVLEKVGFTFVGEDDMFKYYTCKRQGIIHL